MADTTTQPLDDEDIMQPMPNEEEPNENQPQDEDKSHVLKVDMEPKKLNIVTKLNPEANLVKRSLRSQKGEIYPTPSGPGTGQSSDEKAKQSGQRSADTSFTFGLNFTGENAKRKKQVVSVYSLVAIPALVTLYRTYYANGGPTFFSYHPMMMTTSVVCMLTAMLFQFLGGEDNIVRVASVSIASALSLLIGLAVIWTTKEGYAKTHFVSMHSHFGIMAIFGVLCYALAALCIYDPINKVSRLDQTWQRRLITWGKGAASLVLTSMFLGTIEVEHSWTMMFFWMSSLSLMLPLLVLDWHKQPEEHKDEAGNVS